MASKVDADHRSEKGSALGNHRDREAGSTDFKPYTEDELVSVLC